MAGKRKVIARVFGGLGNQLFIYAAARRLALVNNAELVIDDVTGFQRDIEYRRHYMLDNFHISGRKATPNERMQPFRRVRRSLALRINQRREFHRRTFIQQQGVDFEPALLSLSPIRDVYLEGYWQSEQYFKDIENVIRHELQIDPPEDEANSAMATQIYTVNSVALHVRFFDQSNSPASNNVPGDYYRRALEFAESNIERPHYFIFSDDPESALEQLPVDGSRVTLVDQNTGDEKAHYDLWLMTQCRHVVMANSTFSWWGAWLGERPGRRVVTPGFEMRHGITAWGFRGLLPDRWTKL